jgi:hypothetical protein
MRLLFSLLSLRSLLDRFPRKVLFAELFLYESCARKRRKQGDGVRHRQTAHEG